MPKTAITRAKYLPHAQITFGPKEGFGDDRQLAKFGKNRRVALQVPDYDSALSLLKGTPIIATLPRQLIHGSASGLCSASPRGTKHQCG